MAFQISLNSTQSKIVREYNPSGIQLNGVQYELGLKHFSFWNTIYNINNENNILKLEDQTSGTHKSHIITIPPGYYELDDIIHYINEEVSIKNSCTTIEVVKRSLKIKVKSEWQIDFTGNNSIGSVLGFSKRIIKANKASYSDLPVNVLNISTVKIHCNLINSNIEDTRRNTNVLYDFPLDVKTIGGKVIKEPTPISYFSVNTNVIYELVIRITDQKNKLIDFHGDEVNLTLDFHPIK